MTGRYFPIRLQINHITSNDLMLGVRWKFGGGGPAPMPVSFK